MKSVYLAYIILLLSFNRSLGQSYYFRHYQVEQGLSNNTVYCTMQDEQRFLWFGTKDGLNRFDGYSFKLFRHDDADKRSVSSNLIHTLCAGNNGSFWIGTDRGLDIYNPQTESFEHITTNNGVRCITLDKNGNCWFISQSALYEYNSRNRQITNYQSYQHFDATSVAINSGDVWVSTSGGLLEKLDTVKHVFKSFSVFKEPVRATSSFIEKLYAAGNNQLFVGTNSQGFKLFDCVTGSYRDMLTYNADNTEVYVRDFARYNNHQFWIATESGLFIYDTQNHSFTNLKKQFSDPYSISDNAIYSVYRDNQGGMWAGTFFGGVNYYPTPYAAFNKFYPSASDNGLRGNVVREICKDDYGNLWMGTEDAGLNKLSADKRTWTHYYPGIKDGLSNTNIHGLLANGKELFIGTFERGLDVLDIPTGKVVRHYAAGKAANMLKSNFIVTFCKTRVGIILLGTTQGVYQYNTNTQDFTQISGIPLSDFIYCITEDHEGKLWIGTVRDGIYHYDPVKKTAVKLVDKNNQVKALGNVTVNGIFEDSNHGLWIATDGLGLWHYDTGQNAFTVYDLNKGFPSNYVFRILEDNHHNIWISTSRGLVCLNLFSRHFKIYTKANGLLSDQFNYNSAFKDADGTLYFGCVKGMVSFKPSAFKPNDFIAPVYITGLQVHNQEIMVNGNDSLLHQSVTTAKCVKLRYDQSSFSIDFAALNYQAPEMTQYKYMMKGLDKGWTQLKTNRKVYFTQLAPGRYTFMVKAANSNSSWLAKETRLDIIITPPFWKCIWAYILYAILLALIAWYLLRRYHLKTREKNDRLIASLENDKEKQIYTAKIEFFTNVAHEIRTPLTLIKGPMEKVIKKAGSVPEIQNNLMIMEKNTNRLLDLTNQLLDFRRTETNGFSLSFVKTDISALLADTYLRFKPMAEQKNIGYELIQPAATLFAYVDIEAFTKIISNLISNAIKYGESTVMIELLENQAKDTTFSIIMSNDGYLVPFTLREKIFEPFFRLQETEKQIGTGIGLSLSRSLAELHNGQLVLNKPDNGRNVFMLTLPIHQEKEFDLSQMAESDDQQKQHRHITPDFMKPIILLVDDNPEILDFIADDLDEKYSILKAQNGQQALDMMGIENIQLIISDVMMPVMDGFELCKKIKTDFEYSHIPIILLTAKNTLQSKIEGLEVGADAYIEKPFSPEHLQVQIANLLINRSKIRDRFASSPLANINTMAYSRPDENFLDKLNAAITQNIQNPELDVEQIAGLMNMSKPTLYRKIKAISNLTINELINITRLKAAARLLEEGDYKIYEVAAMVGYSSQSHLGRNFLKQFGATPTDYQQNKRVNKTKTSN